MHVERTITAVAGLVVSIIKIRQENRQPVARFFGTTIDSSFNKFPYLYSYTFDAIIG